MMASNRICSIPECGKPHEARGYCKMHYKRLSTHGDPLGGRTPDGELQRFFEEVVLPYDGNDCLVWPFSRDTNGRGQIKVGGKKVVVSRRVCEEANGPPPTPKHEAAHSCGNGHEGCVTKGHLVWKTPKQNSEDKIRHGTLIRGERCNFAKITESQAREILALKGKETLRSIAGRFGITQGAVSQIQNGKRWAWIQEDAA